MRAYLSTCAAILSCSLILGGCGSGRTTDYPDQSPETTRRVDDTRRHAENKKAAIDKEYAAQTQRLDFQERQVREKYKAEREALSIETDQKLTRLNAQRRQLELKREGDLSEDPDRVKTDGDEPKDLASIREEITALERQSRERDAQLERDQTRELIDLEKQRNRANEAMREEKLEVDRWTTKELESIDRKAHDT